MKRSCLSCGKGFEASGLERFCSLACKQDTLSGLTGRAKGVNKTVNKAARVNTDVNIPARVNTAPPLPVNIAAQSVNKPSRSEYMRSYMARRRAKATLP